MTALEGIREYQEKATEGPWRDDITDEGELVVRMGKGHDAGFGGMEDTCAKCHANARFIANARTDLPLLLAFADAYDAWRRSRGIASASAYFGMVEARATLEREWSGATKQEQP